MFLKDPRQQRATVSCFKTLREGESCQPGSRTGFLLAVLAHS